MHLLPALPGSGLSPALTAAPLAGVMVASVWQGILLILVVALGLRVLPALSAAARSAVWTAVLLLILALPLLAALSPHTAAPATGVLHLEETVSFLIVGLWVAASVFRLFQLGASAIRLRAILRRAQPISPPPPVARLLRSAVRPVTLCTSADVDRPSVAGFLRPRILFPPELIAALTEAELAHIVLHETEHLRRCDDWINLVQQISLVLFPLNPALLWLNRRLSLERELACDDGVLQATRARKAYAACLARVAETSLLRRSAALVLGILGTWTRKSELTRRVERILRTPGKTLSPFQMRLATASLLAVVLGSAGALAHSPELVTFGPAMPAYARAEAAGALDLPVSHLDLPHPTLVKAILPQRGSELGSQRGSELGSQRRSELSPAPRPIPGFLAPRASGSVPPLARVHRQLGLAVHRRPNSHPAPFVVLASFRQPASVAPPRPIFVSDQIDLPAVRLTTVVFERSQSWYTAVAVRDGWILVQL